MHKKLRFAFYFCLICLLMLPSFVWTNQSRAIEVKTSEEQEEISDTLKDESTESSIPELAQSNSTVKENIVETETPSISSSEEEQKESDTTDSSESTSSEEEPVRSRQTRADEITWTVVEDSQALKTELGKADPPTHIKLGGDGVFSLSTAVPVKSNVVIDGDGKTVSYPSDGLSSGIYADSSNIEVTLQNMTFGSPDYSVPMKNLYGIFPASDSEVVKLNVNNVNYYSNNGAQAFHINETGSEIHFFGENEFILEGSGQEFAEASAFYFEQGSKTTVRHQTGSNDGFIWARRSNNSNVINLAEDAVFDVESNHSFIYNDIRGGNISVGKNAKLLIKSVNVKGSSSKYPIRYDGGKWDISVAENGLLDISYPNSIQLADPSNIYIGKGADARFETTEEKSVFDRSVGANSTFVVDNANLVEFTAVPDGGINPIGFVNGTNKFSFAPFAAAEGDQQGTEGYAIRTTPSFAINSQKASGTWNISTGDITREAVTDTNDFTTEEKNAMKAATTIQLVKIPEPRSQIAMLKKTSNYLDFSVQLSNYELFNNTFAQVRYRLYAKEADDPTVDSADFIEEKTTTTIDGEVTFDGLEQDTKYWLYAQIECDPSGQSSYWFEDTVKTKAMINVEVPTYIAFRTDMDANVVQDREYAIKNNGTSPVNIKVNSFQVKSNSDNIPLLSETDINDSAEGLFLKLVSEDPQGIELVNLENPVTKPLFGTIDGGTSKKIGLGGKYQGTIEEVMQLDSQLTLLIEDGSSEEGTP